MKRLLLKLAALLTVTAIFCAVPAYYFDPFNVFHWDKARITGAEPNKNYIKTRYVVENPEKFNGFILGSSRVGSLHTENIADARIYNMTHADGLPIEHLQTLETFLKNRVKIETVFLGIDGLTFTNSYDEHLTSPVHLPYQKLGILNLCKMYMDPAVLLQGRQYLHLGKLPLYDSSFYTHGWWCDYDNPVSIPEDATEPYVDERYPTQQVLSYAELLQAGREKDHPAIRDIQAVKELCDANGIKLVVFTNPMMAGVYLDAVDDGYLSYLAQLTEFTDFYNFAGLNAYTVGTEYFVDTSHYNAYLGDMVLNVMCGDAIYEESYAQGFGWHVTSENISEFLQVMQTAYQK